jgi:hypothetical protein
MKSQHLIRIDVCSDIEFEHLIAEIYIDGKFVSLISQEDGRDNLKIEFPKVGVSEDSTSEQFDLEQFMRAVQQAKERLINDQ